MAREYRHLIQRRFSATFDHLLPHRWNWTAPLRPLDRSLARQSEEPLPFSQVRSQRFFWLDGLFASISDHFYLGFIPLYALALGATSAQVGWLASVANLSGAVSLFPGARLIEKTGRRKPIVVVSGGVLARLTLLALALIPLVTRRPELAIVLVVLLEGARAFTSSLANPAWTELAADLVPPEQRSRYFGSRNVAMGLAALIIAPLAGRLIQVVNQQLAGPLPGYQLAFFLAFLFGILSTVSYQRIVEPPARRAVAEHHRGDLRRALRAAPLFLGFVASAVLWNLSLQVAGPFFNIYLVQELGAGAAVVGTLAAASSLTSLLGQRHFSRVQDRHNALWVLLVTGLLIPFLPLAWALTTASWQVALINMASGFLWAGYNLANFNELLELTPDEQRARAVALYQTAVFGSAVLGPLLGGYLSAALGFRVVFVLSGIGRFLAILLLLLFVARPLRRQQPPHTRI
jgi:MFS family permease